MNNSNALAEIQSKYPNCNLLLPSATSVQINPFYKCSVMEVVADTAPNSGDIFSVGKVKTGEDGKGKAIYEDVFSPAKPLLMKLATAAGIQFHPEYTTVTRENTNTYVGKAYGAVRLPDGSYKTHMETKRICLDDEESKYRLEFMDKSIMGIHDWRAAKAASEMFKGEWKDDPEKTNQWGKPEKYYVIADSDREKYIERSILVNMTLLRKTASEKAQTGAILRVIRALLGIKGTYSKAELEKPFVVPTVTFAPDYTDPTVRSAMLQQGMNSMSEQYCPSQVFLCTEYYGNPICFNTEMEDARFEDVGSVLDMDLFLPFRLSLEDFLRQLDEIRLTAEVSQSNMEADGGPGSGRYPKGSGKKNEKSGSKKKKSQSLPMTAKEKAKVTHDINNVYHAKYKGKSSCYIRTHSNEPDSPAYVYRFRNHGFDDYEIYMKESTD